MKSGQRKVLDKAKQRMSETSLILWSCIYSLKSAKSAFNVSRRRLAFCKFSSNRELNLQEEAVLRVVLLKTFC